MSLSHDLEITDVRIRHVDPPDPVLKAYASIEFNGLLAVHGLKVLQGKGGLCVGMPARRARDGGMTDIVHPTSVAARNDIEAVVLAAYREDDWRQECAGVGAPVRPPPDRLIGGASAGMEV